MDMKIYPKPGDISVGLSPEIRLGLLFLCQEAVFHFVEMDIRSASEVMSYMRAHPSGVASAFGWSDSFVEKETSKLAGLLKGKIHDDILNPPPVRVVPLGARKPM